jgi:hypothetical protein
MWPCRKGRQQELSAQESASGADRWLLARGERDGLPMIIRMAEAYRELAPVPEYDHHIIVSVRLRNPQPSGFPSAEEGDDLQNLEVKLCALLEPGNDTLCVLVITNNGLRDFIFQTREVERAKGRLEDAGDIFRGFGVELAIEPDADWEIYRTFERMLGSSA